MEIEQPETRKSNPITSPTDAVTTVGGFLAIFTALAYVEGLMWVQGSLTAFGAGWLMWSYSPLLLLGNSMIPMLALLMSVMLVPVFRKIRNATTKSKDTSELGPRIPSLIALVALGMVAVLTTFVRGIPTSILIIIPFSAALSCLLEDWLHTVQNGSGNVLVTSINLVMALLVVPQALGATLSNCRAADHAFPIVTMASADDPQYYLLASIESHVYLLPLKYSGGKPAITIAALDSVKSIQVPERFTGGILCRRP